MNLPGCAVSGPLIRAARTPRRAARAPIPDHTLAEFQFGIDARGSDDPRHIPVSLAQLGSDRRVERWSTDAPVTTGTYRGDFSYAHDGNFLFASLRRARRTMCATWKRVTRSSYLRLDHLIRHEGYPYWLRAWNYFAEITAGEGEAERYRRFNAGRHSAVGLSSSVGQNLPAASALGSDGGGFVLCALAGRNPGDTDRKSATGERAVVSPALRPAQPDVRARRARAEWERCAPARLGHREHRRAREPASWRSRSAARGNGAQLRSARDDRAARQGRSARAHRMRGWNL